MCIILVLFTNNSAIKYQDVSLNVILITNQSKFDDLLYLTVNIVTIKVFYFPKPENLKYVKFLIFTSTSKSFDYFRKNKNLTIS